MPHLKSTAFVTSLALSVGFYSCNDGNDDLSDELVIDTTTTASAIDTSDQNTAYKLHKAKNIFYSIPSPVEMATMLKKVGAEYEFSHLNDPQKHNQYLDTKKQALNLGVYSSDLAYTCIFNQSNESMYFMEVNRKLADEIDISSAIDNQTVERFDANVGNRDSVLKILSETYWKVDAYLKENDRDNVSALIMAGGWIEGMYLTTRTMQEQVNNEQARSKIAEQKYSLINLVSILETYGNDPMITEVRSDLQSLLKIYNKVNITRENASVTTDPESNITVLGGTNKIDMPEALLQEIAGKVEEVRNNIIDPSK